MNSFWRTIAVAACVAAHCTSGFGQAAEQPVVLTIELGNLVLYRGDVTDSAKLARDPGVTTPGPSRAFQYSNEVSDIVAVNGTPAKGLQTCRTSALIARVNPQPGQTIADHDGNGPYLCFWQFQGPGRDLDRQPVGRRGSSRAEPCRPRGEWSVLRRYRRN